VEVKGSRLSGYFRIRALKFRVQFSRWFIKVFRGNKPPWGKDSLSKVLKSAEYNTLISTKNYGKIYGLLVSTYELLLDAERAIKYRVHPNDIFPAFLFLKVHSSFLASIRTILSGQAVEAHPIMRLMIEQAWYGLYIKLDPKPPKRRKIWLNRNDSEAGKKRCRREFTIANVRKAHKAVDPEVSAQLGELYEHTIDYGAHPNQYGVFSNLNQDNTSGKLKYSVGMLAFDMPVTMMSIRITIAIAIGYLKIIENRYKDGYDKNVSQQKVDKVIDGLNTYFVQWAESSSQIIINEATSDNREDL